MQIALSLRDLLMEQSHMLHVWYIYLHNWVICKANVGIHIPAPWSKKGSVSFPPNFGDFGMKRNVLPLQRVHVVHISLPLPFETRFKVAVQSDVDLMWTYRFESKNKPGPVRP
jgi:hypothetical protein